MGFLNDHATMTADEVRADMLDFLTASGHSFDGMQPTPENINWMVAVYAIDLAMVETADDLTNLLAAMNKQHEGPINIHEGWGGCEADSNKELITEKIAFDLRENIEAHNVAATVAAIELGWYSATYYDELLDDSADTLVLARDEREDGEDAMRADFSRTEGVLLLWAYGRTFEDRYLYREHAAVECDDAEFDRLFRRVHALPNSAADRCAYVRAWATRKGSPLQPYL